jgi:hypothetical protein
MSEIALREQMFEMGRDETGELLRLARQDFSRNFFIPFINGK